MAKGKTAAGGKNNGADLGYEARLWQMADALRGSMDAAEYKHVVLGLIFLKYISDAFEELHARLESEREQGADPEDRDEYIAQNIFWVPPESRWSFLKAQAKQPAIGRLVDDAMEGIERDNPALKGVLPKDYARPTLDKARLGQLIDMVSNIQVGNEDARARDVLGRVYEYFLSQFASAEGKKGGEFYTPRCVVRLLVEMLEPYRGRVYDPCCGSAGMFVQSVEFIRAHATGNGNGGRRGAARHGQADISIYGQESNYTTWRRPGSPVSSLPTAPCPQIKPAKVRYARTSSRRTSWTAWWRFPASFSIRPRSPRACGSSVVTNDDSPHPRWGRVGVKLPTAAARSSSSTPGSSVAWWTAPTAS